MTKRIKLKLHAIVLLAFLSLTAFASDDTVWIDVRSVLEHKLDSIDGDVRISHSEIVEEVAALYPNKDTPIALYCRSGGRAGKALSALNSAGYKNVRNVGGIGQAREERALSE